MSKPINSASKFEAQVTTYLPPNGLFSSSGQDVIAMSGRPPVWCCGRFKKMTVVVVGGGTIATRELK